MKSNILPLIVADKAIPFLDHRFDGVCNLRRLAPADIDAQAVGDADALLVRTRTRCDARLLDGSKVEYLATATIGTDHFDIPYLDAKGIDWRNAPGCNAPAVAQYVWRALYELGFDPKTQTLGLVGKGNIGRVVAEWGRRLGCRVIVSDPPRQEQGLTDEDYLPLDRLMAEADAVTFHTPLTRHESGVAHPTFHLASEEALGKLRDGAILINAARGGVVDEAALRRLKGEKSLRVALDTWEGEPTISPESLQMADIATFHIAGYSRQGKERATYACLEGLERHFNIELPKSDLTGPYTPPARLDRETIIESYDIMADDAMMRAEPEAFERLRDTYHLREEII
ncbi:MAG: 4-phosphoerythronate dehydrogenase [Muribaculaceae bacterium]|nr:4-phosphoerythronate dehydrogenase [Muribaculaceae bacterium]MDE5924070.1 4-phosphoerythronate dehydrogenase [Muribaculaceae bacterium]